jgi:hypothetical protein
MGPRGSCGRVRPAGPLGFGEGSRVKGGLPKADMDHPTVSILVPVYNREAMISRCLESALAQSYGDIEVVACDNASSDRTFDVLRTYEGRDPRVRCYRNSENIGPVQNWRRCLDRSAGQYIQFLFSDDWLEPSAIEQRVEALRDRTACGFVFSSVCLHQEPSGASAVLYRSRTTRTLDSFLFLRGWLSGYPPVPFSPGAALFRREDVTSSLTLNIPTETGGRCVPRGIGPDLLLYLRSCEKYPLALQLPQTLSHFAGHGSSITSIEKRWFRHYCYDAAFGWFLATADPGLRGRERLHTLLYLRSLDPARWRGLSHGSPWAAYVSLFPPGYDCRPMRWRAADVMALLAGAANRATLRLKLSRGSAPVPLPS